VEVIVIQRIAFRPAVGAGLVVALVSAFPAACIEPPRIGGDLPDAMTPSNRTDASVGSKHGDTAAMATVPPANAACQGTVFGALAPLRRLTREEFNNTVRDLLMTPLRPADSFAPDRNSGGFYSNVDSPIGDEGMAQNYLAAAEALATEALDLRFAAVTGCQPTTTATDETRCATDFVKTFGRRAFRRPLTAGEASRYLMLFTTARGLSGSTFSSAMRTVLSGFLQSPLFLNHVEIGGPPAPANNGVVSLTPYEIASRLSYMLWQTMPDTLLFQAAERNELTTPDQLVAQARRLLMHPNAKVATWHFFERYLSLDYLPGTTRDPAHFPAFEATAPVQMSNETQEFVNQVLWAGDARFFTLFTAPYTYVNSSMPAVSTIYETPKVTTAGFQKVALDPARRAGLLTQPGFLTAHAKSEATDPVRRGLFVRKNLLCQVIPPPMMPVVEPPMSPTLTTRQRYEMHMTGSCGACHRYINPPGFAFETYDPIGQYRTMENGITVDGSVILEPGLGASDIDGSYPGYVALAQKIAVSKSVKSCFSRFYMSYALGRAVGGLDRRQRRTAGRQDEECSLEKLAADFIADPQGDVRELLIAIVKNSAFRNVRLTPRGACQ
jgi:hypothetical protein